ncbi:Chitinase 2 [Dispira parvispora]|uniref:chitinase n=1 Tax=Dispira parvispora TaxID=1520584 RepID=A0A9W8APA5_9FUNG|nr:Chitinase 2 [Dispira parvispora]
MARFSTGLLCGLAFLFVGQWCQALDTTCNSNLVAYWGQNAFKAKHNDTNGEKDLDWYCTNTPSEDVLVISFLNTYDPMVLNLADHCFDFFENSKLLTCPKLTDQIKRCQDAGKTILLSLGGQEGSYALTSGEEGTELAHQIWDTFLGGSSDTRPFGDAVLDGVDLDIEKNSAVGYTDFVKTLRDLFDQDKARKYYVAVAPICPFPDLVMPETFNEAWFDMVFVQFYNSPCGVDNFGTPSFNFHLWDKWARYYSVNKDVKVYLGVPASTYGAVTGYVETDRLFEILDQLRSRYPSFGGVMLYDISESRPNNDYSKQVKDYLKEHEKCG